MQYRADLHIHTCLSPCGSLEMSPRAIVQRALEVGINLIGIADHNNTSNCVTFEKICKETAGIECLYGLEATTAEEIHVVCLFDTVMQAKEFGDYWYSTLTPVKNIPEKLGDQVYVDEDDGILGEVEIFLNSASTIGIDGLRVLVHERGGLVVPAHVDRSSNSLSSQLGYLPPGDFDALELSKFFVARSRRVDELNLQGMGSCPFVTASDAHYLHDIGKAYIEFEVDELSVEALRAVLEKKRFSKVSNARVL